MTKKKIRLIKKSDPNTVVLEEVRSMLRPLCQAYEKLSDAFQKERKRRSTIQTYIGEAVTDELLHQSYGIPEYSTEEKFKRLLSAILNATEKTQNIPQHNIDSINDIIELWDPEDPHSIPFNKVKDSEIKIRKIESPTSFTVSQAPPLPPPTPEEPKIGRGKRKLKSK